MAKNETGVELPTVYFFPERDVTEDEVRRMLLSKLPGEREEVVSHLLRYAEWDDIWRYVSRDEVRSIFDRLDLPDSLRKAWARMLKIEPVLS